MASAPIQPAELRLPKLDAADASIICQPSQAFGRLCLWEAEQLLLRGQSIDRSRNHQRFKMAPLVPHFRQVGGDFGRQLNVPEKIDLNVTVR